MALYDGTNAPLIKVYFDVGNRNESKFILNYSPLGGSAVLGSYVPFTTLQLIPTTDVKRIAIRRGRTREDQAVQPGSLTMVLDNTIGNYDPQVNVSGVISAATGNGSQITYTHLGIETFVVGQVVTITSLSTSSYNVDFGTITSVGSSTQFTIAKTGVTGTITGQSGIFYKGYYNTAGQSILIAGTGVRVTATATGYSETTIYTGYLEQMDIDMSLEPTVTITCVDAMAKIAKLFTNIYTNGLPDSYAIEHILTSAGWNGGGSALPLYGSADKYTVSIIPTGNALDMIQTIADSGLGVFYVNAIGQAYWLNYDYFAPGHWATLTKLFTMTDERTSTDVIEYDSIEVIGGEKYALNTATFNNVGTDGVTRTVTEFNGAGVGRYGPIERQLDTYLKGTDAITAAQNLADWFAQPEYRVNSISAECVGFSPALWYKVLQTEIGSPINVDRKPIYGYKNTYNSFVQEINHDITPDSWRMTLTLSPGK